MKTYSFADNETVVGQFSSYKKSQKHGESLLGKTPPGIKLVHRKIKSKWFLIVVVQPVVAQPK